MGFRSQNKKDVHIQKKILDERRACIYVLLHQTGVKLKKIDVYPKSEIIAMPQIHKRINIREKESNGSYRLL